MGKYKFLYKIIKGLGHISYDCVNYSKKVNDCVPTVDTRMWFTSIITFVFFKVGYYV